MLFEQIVENIQSKMNQTMPGGNRQSQQAQQAQKAQQSQQDGGNCQAEQAGGKKMSLSALKDMTVVQLKKIAQKRNLNIYKKKDGKNVPIKKDTLVNKIYKSYK